MNTIYESNSTGRPVTSNGKIIKTNNNRRIIYNNPNGTHALYRNNNLKLLNINPSDSSKNIKQHESSKHQYRIIGITNKNGGIIDKFVLVNKDGQNIMDGENYIYLNKNTGEPISGNGNKYKYNSSSGKFVKIDKLGILYDLIKNFDVVVGLYISGKPLMKEHIDFLNTLKNQFEQNYTDWTLKLDEEIKSLTSDKLFAFLDRFISYIKIKKKIKITTDSLLFKMISVLVTKILFTIHNKEFKRSGNWENRDRYDESRDLFDFLWTYNPIKAKTNGKIIDIEKHKKILKNYRKNTGLPHINGLPHIFAHDFLKKFINNQ